MVYQIHEQFLESLVLTQVCVEQELSPSVSQCINVSHKGLAQVIYFFVTTTRSILFSFFVFVNFDYALTTRSASLSPNHHLYPLPDLSR